MIDSQEIEEFLNEDSHCKKLNDAEADGIEGKISELELGLILKKGKNGSAPGSSGFNYSFYKFFWRDLKTFITRCANYSYETGSLPTSQRYGLISVIPKGKKDQELLSNWRPLTLLNCVYKIISGAIANRINSILPKIIDQDQSGFVRGRFIGDSIRTTFDVMEWAKKNNKVGLLLLIDFTKAFDSISFSFIEKTLTFFGFKENIRRWVTILLKNFTASTVHAGNISLAFKILRGCRQGDPSAPPLFILAIEILCIKLRNSATTKGYKIEDLEFLLSLYADDCTIFLEFDEENLRNCVKILEDFYLISGLKIHVQKTKCIIFGEKPDRYNNICPDLKLKWETEFTLLGITFDSLLENMEINFEEKITEIETVISNWRYRLLTPLGRCCVAKTLLLSKLSHLTMVLPALDKKKITRIENLIYKYIWRGRDKVARIDAKKPILLGGLNMPDIVISWKAFKLSWFRRIANCEAKWKNLLKKNLAQQNVYSFFEFFNMGTAELTKLSKKIQSSFWSETISVIKPFMLELVKKYPEEIINCNIWGSDLFTRNNSILLRKHFPNIPHIIKTPSDILKKCKQGSEFINIDEFISRYGYIDNDSFISFKLCLHYSLRKWNVDLNMVNFNCPFRPGILNLINMSVKGCSRWTNLLKDRYVSENTRKLENKWNERLGALQDISFWNDSYRKVKDIFFNNKLKWFHYQIVRGTLKTNRIVSKFKDNVKEECTFCDTESETILHLFWDCKQVENFIVSVQNYAKQFFPDLMPNITKKEFIFGKRIEQIFSRTNYFVLHLKYFIWICRCKKNQLSLQNFKSWLIFEAELDKAHGNSRLDYLEELIDIFS